jgi:hypothetical protein
MWKRFIKIGEMVQNFEWRNTQHGDLKTLFFSFYEGKVGYKFPNHLYQDMYKNNVG